MNASLRLATLALSLLVVATSPPLRAGAAEAEALFRDGRRLLVEGKLDEACPKLEESQRQDPSSGTLLNLALCHEKQGRLAKAWAEYVQAAVLARQQGKPERATTAESQARALEPRVPKLRLSAVRAAAALEIDIDGNTMGAGAMGVAVPLDPGKHQLTARAPGRREWQTTVTLAEGETTAIEIPELEADVPPPRPAPAIVPPVAPAPRAPVPAEKAAPRPPERSASLTPWIVGAAGVAALGVGAFYGLSSLSNYDKADSLCPEHAACSSAAIDQRERAERQAWVSNVALALGVAGVGASVYLFVSESREGPATRVGATASPRALCMSATGRF